MHRVFITGCSSGFGAGTARALLAAGHQVYATDPDLGALSTLESLGARVLRLDLREPESIRRAVDVALDEAPPTALVNNGGFAVFATQEEGDVDQMRDLFDVNVFGAARVTQALLPQLRACAGTIVQLSSVAGRTVFPESGWYAATKHALEAMSDALYQETCTFGVRVRLIEPGSFDTGFLPAAIAASPPQDPGSPYAHLHPVWSERKVDLLEPPQDPSAVVAAIVAALDDPRPFYRQPVGPDAVRMIGLKRELGADAATRLAGQRNGGPAVAVLTPDEVITAPEDALHATRIAWQRGHLRHWERTAIGRQALERLRA